MFDIVLFVKTLERTSFGHMPVYVIEFVIELIVICFENNIKSLMNVTKRIPGEWDWIVWYQDTQYPQVILTLGSHHGVRV